jgi:signal transduction histidine kinase
VHPHHRQRQGDPTADQLARIFDFNFQAEGDRVKMGFGLATDYRIVQDHLGEIHIESEVGKGTQVTAKLPTRPGACFLPDPLCRAAWNA